MAGSFKLCSFPDVIKPGRKQNLNCCTPLQHFDYSIDFMAFGLPGRPFIRIRLYATAETPGNFNY
jgi:hypothetical protein